MPTGCSVQFGCQKHLELPFLHFFCPTINGPKDAKMWPVRGFALLTKDAVPTNMGFHHSFFAVRILIVGFFGVPPNGLPKMEAQCITQELRAHTPSFITRDMDCLQQEWESEHAHTHTQPATS